MRRKTKGKHKSGKIIPNGVSLEKHELDTVLVFTELGYDVELIPVSFAPRAKSPDIIILGKIWEMKSPTGHGDSTLEHNFKKAAKQSENVIIDLRRTKIQDKVALGQLEHLFSKSKRVKRMKVITKNKKVVDFGE